MKQAQMLLETRRETSGSARLSGNDPRPWELCEEGLPRGVLAAPSLPARNGRRLLDDDRPVHPEGLVWDAGVLVGTSHVKGV